MNFYRRKLPHWQPEGARYFITFRLAGSLPRKVIEELKKLRQKFQNGEVLDDSDRPKLFQEKIFQKYEQALDAENTGPIWLKTPAIANLVQESIHYRDSKEYDLYAYCIMSNHVHLVFQHLSKKLNTNVVEKNFPITKILQELKRYTAYKSNKILGRTGAFWQSESYDRVIRDKDELENTILYTLNNPVKAGLVERWEGWPYSYCKPEFINTFKS
jgi:REP element-mobilizing transposase RayT